LSIHPSIIKAVMKRIFITGMSGTGKTSVIEMLCSRGFTAIDTDYDGWCAPSDRNGETEWLLREDKLSDLLNRPSTSPLFVAGCRSNQSKFYKFFDCRVLLAAPLEIMLARVAERTSNPYGKTDQQRAEIRWNFEHIEPLLRQSTDLEIDSSKLSVCAIADHLSALVSSE
jgi:shikimate kinase